MNRIDFVQSSRSRQITVPYICEDLAEDIGIQIGDGCIGRYKRSKKDGSLNNVITVVGDLKEGGYYLKTTVLHLKKRLYGSGINFKTYRNIGGKTIVLYTSSKNLVNFYEHLGLPVGPKNNINIPKFIFQDKKLQIAFIRGLADTDGCLSFRINKSTKRHDRPVIRFATKSKTLALGMCKIFENLGFTYSKCLDVRRYDTRYKTREYSVIHDLYVSGKKNLEKWMDLVGFSNIVPLTRYRVYRKLGYCPPGTTLKHRLEILGG